MKQFLVINRSKCLFFALFLLLNGCQIHPPPSSEKSDFVVFHVLVQVTTEAVKNKTKNRFNLLWKRIKNNDDKHQDSILIRSTIGTTIAKIEHTPEQTILKKDGKKIIKKNADELTKELLGYTLPVEAFGYWIIGKTNPSTPSYKKTSPDGTIKIIQQEGWKIEYNERDSEKQPKKIHLTSPFGNTYIVIKRWIKT